MDEGCLIILPFLSDLLAAFSLKCMHLFRMPCYRCMQDDNTAKNVFFIFVRFKKSLIKIDLLDKQNSMRNKL